MENKNRISGFRDNPIHPSLDIVDGVLLLGFRHRDEKRKENTIYLITYNGLTDVSDKEIININEKHFVIEKNKRSLAWLEERWGIDNINRLLAEQEIGKRDISGQEIFDIIINTTKNYVALEQGIDYVLSATWIIGTYFFPIFSAYPMLSLKGPKGSGKSQYLNLLKQLCFNAIKARPTLAALGDTVDALRGTYLIDQADALEAKGNEQLLDTVTDSYKKSGGKRRIINMDKGKRELVEYETYSPKAFASIKELPEDLRDRCLPIALIRSQKNFHDPDDSGNNWLSIRDKLYCLLIDKYILVQSHYSVAQVEYRRNPKVAGRKLELWLPIEIILKCCGLENKINEARQRFMSQYGFSEYEPSELDEAVIIALKDSFGEKSEQILGPKEIAYLVDTEIFAPLDDDKQKAKKVGWVIKDYNLASSKLPRSKAGVRYIFNKARVEQVYNSYFNIQESHTSHTPESDVPDNTGQLQVHGSAP